MRKFTSLAMKAAGLAMALFAVQGMSAGGFAGSYYLKAVDFETGEESAYGLTYLNGVEITIAPPSTQANWDLVVTNLCGQGTVYGGTLSGNDSILTLTNLGYAYFSDRDYSGKGTESLGSPEGTMMGNITITLNPDGSLAFSDFTVINTVLGDAPSFRVLATYRNTMATPLKEYYFSCAEDDFTTSTSKEAPSPHGIVYARHWGFKVRRYFENERYDVEVSGLGGIASCKAYGSLDDDGAITLTTLSGAYLSAYEGYGGAGTESLGTAEGTILGGKMSLTLQPDGTYSVSDFTAVNTKITDGVLGSEVMASWKGGKAVPAQKYHFAPTTFTKGEDSPHGVVYPEEFDFTLRECIENDNYDVVVTGMCGREGVKSYGTSDADGRVTLKTLGGTYLTPYEGYSGVGTESLGSDTGAFTGSISFTPAGDGSYGVDTFTAINMVIDGMPLTTILAKWEDGRAWPLGDTQPVGPSSSVGQVRTVGPMHVRVENGTVFLGESMRCDVFSMSGTLLLTGLMSRIDGLRPGIYVIRTEKGMTSKLIIKN